MSRKGIKCRNLKMLTDKQIKSIHDSTMRILGNVGIKVLNKDALEIYHDNGCRVDFDKKIVRISEDVLMNFLSKAPEKFILFGKNEDYDLYIDCNSCYLMGGAAGIRILDLDGKYREPDSTDLDNFTRLQDALPNIDIICPMVIPKNIDAEILELYISAEAMKNTYKNCDLWVHSSLEVDYQIKIAEVITEQKFSSRPIFTLCIDLISPMVQPDDVLDTMIEAVKRDVPVYIETCDMMGSTSPVTIAGTLVQQSVNILPGIALAQMIKSGAPCFYSIASAASDMRSGIFLAADPVSVLLNSATAQIAHYYNLPLNNGTSLDSKLPDIQAGYERAFQNMGCISSGANVVHLGAGMLEQMLMANYEMTVIDDEIFGMCRKFFEEVVVNDERIGEESISKVFLSGRKEYLSEDHTLKYFKENLWGMKVTDKENYEVWNRNGRVDAASKAKEVAKELIKNHYPNIVDEKKDKMISNILEEAKIKLAEIRKIRKKS